VTAERADAHFFVSRPWRSLLLAHSVIRRAAIFLDAIGGIAEIGNHSDYVSHR